MHSTIRWWCTVMFTHTFHSLGFWYLSCLHTTVASLESHPLLVTVPHIPLTQTSTLPSLLVAPPTRRTLPVLEHWGDAANVHNLSRRTYWLNCVLCCAWVTQHVGLPFFFAGDVIQCMCKLSQTAHKMLDLQRAVDNKCIHKPGTTSP